MVKKGFLPPGVNKWELIWGVLGIGIVSASLIGGYYGYHYLDNIGWISHKESTIISVSPNWLEGESKSCTSVPLAYDAAHAAGKPEGYALAEIDCDDGPKHDMSVTFYGRKKQPESVQIAWRCTRERAWALNAETFKCLETDSIKIGDTVIVIDDTPK